MSLYKENSTSMYKAFCDNFFMQSIKSMTEDYPKYAILLFYTRYIKNTNVNQAIKTYSEVETIALKDIAKYPIYCAGIVACYERILIEKGRTRKALITSTYELLESFMANSNNKPKADSLKEEEQLATIKDFCDGVVII